MHATYRWFAPILVTALLLGACGGDDDATDATDTTDATAPADPSGSTSDAAEGDGQAGAGDEAASGATSWTLSATGAADASVEGTLAGWEEVTGDETLQYLSLVANDARTKLSIDFPADFTVGEPIDLTAEGQYGNPLADLTLNGDGYDDSVKSGTLTITAQGTNKLDQETISGEYEMVLVSDQNGEVTITGTFENVPFRG